MTKRRHRNPWPVAPVPAWRLAAGDVVVIGGFDYVVAEVARDGLPMAPDGLGVVVALHLVNPGGRCGRPRAFTPPALDFLADDQVAVRAGAAAADWTGF